MKDATGEAVIGASVVVKGTTNGTITDLDGNFALSNVNKGGRYRNFIYRLCYPIDGLERRTSQHCIKRRYRDS